MTQFSESNPESNPDNRFGSTPDSKSANRPAQQPASDSNASGSGSRDGVHADQPTRSEHELAVAAKALEGEINTALGRPLSELELFGPSSALDQRILGMLAGEVACVEAEDGSIASAPDDADDAGRRELLTMPPLAEVAQDPGASHLEPAASESVPPVLTFPRRSPWRVAAMLALAAGISMPSYFLGHRNGSTVGDEGGSLATSGQIDTNQGNGNGNANLSNTEPTPGNVTPGNETNETLDPNNAMLINDPSTDWGSEPLVEAVYSGDSQTGPLMTLENGDLVRPVQRTTWTRRVQLGPDGSTLETIEPEQEMIFISEPVY